MVRNTYFNRYKLQIQEVIFNTYQGGIDKTISKLNHLKWDQTYMRYCAGLPLIKVMACMAPNQ